MKCKISCRAVVLLLMVCTAVILLVSCGKSASEKAAAAVLDRVIACDTSVMTEIMGRDIQTLSDMEQFTMRRLTYDILGEAHTAETVFDGTEITREQPVYVTVDVHGYDLMTLFNEAILYVYANESTEMRSAVYAQALEKLNNGTAATGSFRAVIPMVRGEDGTWHLDGSRVSDDLRDAVTGGAYSWFAAYGEVFGTAAESEDGE